MATKKQGWSTSFFYKQDLRSYYMNNLLNESFRPGIYNPDMYIYADSKGIYLVIKKGTTFLFSNGISYKNNFYLRDLEDPTTYGDFLIKCFAEEDIKTDLLSIDNDYAYSYLGDASKTLTSASSIYVFAKLDYDKEDELGSSRGKEPTFFLGLYNQEKDTFEFKGMSDQIIYKSSTQSSFVSTSYLMLGVIQFASASGSIPSYLNTNSWSSNHNYDKWNKEHVFIGRNVPDYRNDLTLSKSVKCPEILETSSEENKGVSFKKIYLDLPFTSVSGNIFKTSAEVNWKNLGDMKSEGTIDSTGGISVSLDPVDLSSVKGNQVLVTDFIYIPSSFRVSDTDEENNRDVYEDSSLEPELKCYRFLSENSLALENLKSLKDLSDNAQKNTKTEEGNLSDLASGLICVPLDIGKGNQQRLQEFIANKNIIPSIINKMRHDEEITSSELTSFVPVALIFRKMKKEGDSWKTMDEGENITGLNGFNPSNVLSFFDLQFKSTHINNISLNYEDVFTVLPTLE